MVVLIVEAVPEGLRGELSRWMIEPRAGVFVGSLSGMVRDKLWEKVTKGVKGGAATLAYNSNTEQGFAIRTHGERRRRIVDCEGLMLVCLAREEGGPADKAVEEEEEAGK